MLKYIGLKASVWYHANFGVVKDGFQLCSVFVVKNTNVPMLTIELRLGAQHCFDFGSWHILYKM